MPSRQYHTKSRHGCANCKRRKIRCGEERPQCRHCSKLGWKCPFLESDPQGGSIVQLYKTGPASKESWSEKPGRVATGGFSRPAEDLHQFDEELIKQYSEATSLSISDRADVGLTFQTGVLDVALKWSFLQHGLWSLAAMHLRHDCAPELQSLYSDLASLHQDKALEKYIPQLKAITKENCDALFAFSLLLPPLRYSFLMASTEPFGAQEFITEMLNIFDYLVGATVVSTEADAWLLKGTLSQIITIRGLGSIIPQLTEEPKNALITLMSYISDLLGDPEGHGRQSPSHTENSRRLSAYKHSIEMLSNLFPSGDTSRRYLDATIGWPFFSGPDFIRLLKQNDSIALVILGYYGVALHSFRSIWWLGGLGARLVEAVSRVISPTYMQLLMWPLEKISSNGELPSGTDRLVNAALAGVW
ncbi:hypothetical protein B7494_g4478 [Chlorociboria aeruginascens]|nr:hypothetical protein B7494_g4478 [Chlorociboria aeruginascens]